MKPLTPANKLDLPDLAAGSCTEMPGRYQRFFGKWMPSLPPRGLRLNELQPLDSE